MIKINFINHKVLLVSLKNYLIETNFKYKISLVTILIKLDIILYINRYLK